MSKPAFSRSYRCPSRVVHTTLFAAVLVAMLGSPLVAQAQQSTGGLSGTVASLRGGDLHVLIRNVNTNASQTRAPDASGKYSVAGLAPGEYEITVMQDDQPLATARALVRPGSSTAVPQLGSTSAAIDATKLDTVRVTADRINDASDNTIPIDVSTPELVRQYSAELFRKTGVDTSGAGSSGGPYSNLLTALPQQYMSQVATVSGYGGSGYASFGGGSGTETRYYVNEFDTTYDYSGQGANMIPGEMIGNATIIAGGASAKYSNAMGGSISATTKAGDNTWRAGFSSYIVPPYSSFLNRHYKDYRLTDSAGKHYSYSEGGAAYNGSRQTSFNNTAWVSGPLVKDKLFVDLAYQNNEPRSESHYLYGNTFANAGENSHTYSNPAATLTWNITDNQTLDVVASRNKTKDYYTYWTLDQAGNAAGGRDYFRSSIWKMKEDFYLGRYRWHMNDSMDLSLMAGYFTHSEQNLFYGGSIFAQQVTHDSSGNNIYSTLSTGSPDSQYPLDYSKRGYRADWTWQLGSHKIGLGAEHYKFYEDNTGVYGAQGDYTYYDYTSNVATKNSATGITVPANTPYMQSYVASSGGPMTQVNRGVYLEDYWQALDRLVVYAGVRRDNNQSILSDGSRALNFYTTSPRFGLSWDVKGDSSMKLGFTAGRYSMAVPGVILGTALNNYSTTYTLSTYDGINADGSPINPQAFGSYTDASTITDSRTVSSRNIKSALQDNYSLYLQDNNLISGWTMTAELDYAHLKRAISVWRDLDSSYSSAAYQYLQTQGYADPHISNYVLINPGHALTLTNDFNGDGTLETVTIPAADTGIAKPKREAYTFNLEMVHPETPDQPFFLQVSYTWKHVWGNYEGYYAEGDPASNALGTQVFQYSALSQRATGNLPQDIPNSLLINSSHTFGNSGFSGGLGVNWQSGSPKSCFSQYPVADNAAFIAGEHAYYCNGVAVTRGTLGRLPSYWTLNGNAAWQHSWGPSKLRLEFSVYNLLDRDTKVWVNPYNAYTNGTSYTQELRYGGVAYMAPRSATFTLRYTWN